MTAGCAALAACVGVLIAICVVLLTHIHMRAQE